MKLKAHHFIVKAAGGLFILLLLVSCVSKQKKYIIPQKKFVALLVDMHIAEAIGLQSRRNMEVDYRIDSASLYGSVFKKHGVTEAMFDSTFYYYSNHPEKFQKVYNAVTATLKHMEQNIAEEEKQLELSRSEVIWESDTVYKFPERGLDRITIDVPITATGIYTISADVTIFPDDISLDPKMSLYFYSVDSLGSKRILNMPEIRYTIRNGTERTYQAIRNLTDSTYTHIGGEMATYSNTDMGFRRHMEVKNIRVTRKRDEGQGTGKSDELRVTSNE